jgi:hypothetical protein
MNLADAIIVAAGGALDPEALEALADNLQHLVQLLDEPADIREASRAAAALRTLADLV